MRSESCESSVLDCVGADGCRGGRIYFGVAGNGIGAAVLEIGGSCDGVGIGFLVDWKTGAEEGVSLADRGAKFCG